MADAGFCGCGKWLVSQNYRKRKWKIRLRLKKIFRLIQVGANTVPRLDFFQLSTGCSQVFDNMLCLTIHKNTSYSICLEEIHFWANNILPALSSYSGLV
ncbi:hypothetical protein VSS37_05570 [Candidatus Thiothrix sp. Deng01]|uniref:DDE Tnp4 domain-containing protein n=1 Tax=Candidatus Thiothrix phosphatis TaxID=3112415 RepID=A0ABU6CUD7_9GAMM|nr:hypothetical protein [Candidatus Thiothrix sp. Deng01]MEB4590439.1 hypothetical protein [Candidatus Thiothrix sp. Deng01]